MNKIRKIRYILCCLLAVGIMGCSDDDNNSIATGYEGILDNLAASVNATSQELWSTSPWFLMRSVRMQWRNSKITQINARPTTSVSSFPDMIKQV